MKGKTFLTYSLWTPEAAYHSYIHEHELNEKYRVVQSEKAEQWWRSRYAAAPRIETKHVHIIAGAVVPLWQRLKTSEDSKLRVTRVSTKDGERIVGVTIPSTQVRSVLKSIGLNHSPGNDPEKIFAAVLDDDEEVSLVSAFRLKRNRLHGSWAIELLYPNVNQFSELRQFGLINEQIKHKQRFFVPTDKKTGLPILSKLLAQYPVMADEEQEGDQGALPALVMEPVKPVVVNLEEWLLPPELDSPPISSGVMDAAMASVPAVFPIEDSLPDAFLRQAPSVSDVVQTFFWDAANTIKSSTRRKGRPRPVIEEQGLLFSLQ